MAIRIRMQLLLLARRTSTSWNRAASSVATQPILLTDSRRRGQFQTAFHDLQFRRYSSKPADDGAGAAAEIAADEDASLAEQIEDSNNRQISRIAIPPNLPDVPVIAINRNPLFPHFVKMIQIKDVHVRTLIRRKIKLGLPYVGVFTKMDDEHTEPVESLGQLYNVGVFCSISEMREESGTGVMDLVVSAHRRIRIVQEIDEKVDEDASSTATIGRVNGRRRAQRTKVSLVKPPPQPAVIPVSPLSDETMPGAETVGVDSTATPSANGKKLLLMVRTENCPEEGYHKTSESQAKTHAIIQLIREIAQLNPLFGQQIQLVIHPMQNVVENPSMLCDLVGTVTASADTVDLQNLLEEPNIDSRMEMALKLLAKEKLVFKLRADIGKDVERKVQESHRKFLLHEQLKAIKKELGLEKDEKSSVIEKMEEKLKDLQVPEYALKVIKEEMTKLSFLDPHSSEFSVVRNYLEWLTNIPWGKTSEETRDLAKARQILDEDHYGMNDVKDRILEFIAISILKKSVSGKILCFYGPPGVGKTSIAKSIARSLNRQYYRFSVGGMTDVAEIKGHRRTYVGAMPGKMVQCMKKVQTENPLVLIDEVDKIGRSGYHGDPSSALLELLDPEQNANFLDHFLDVPVDLSKVLFICTANILDTIPGPLKDRMELIEVSGYVAEEKLNIANNYLIPQCREASSLTPEQLTIRDDALQNLIRHYCRESGVRNLQKHIEKIFRKAAYKIAGNKTSEQIDVTNENLVPFVGRPKFTSDRLYEVTPAGVVMGLAWTAMGGSALYIEATLGRRLRPSRMTSSGVTGGGDTNQPKPEDQWPGGSLEATGHLGDVMKESMRTAYTVAKNLLSKKFPDNEYLERAHIHVHVPEGATPKDGPSAGCTITSALLSLALDQPVRQKLAMTGEISLTGKVLPVGGIKEKVIAAKRAGAEIVVLPEENRKDFDDLPHFIRADIEVYFCSNYSEVFDIVFPDLSAPSPSLP